MATVVRSMATMGVDAFVVEIEASTIRGQQQSISHMVPDPMNWNTRDTSGNDRI